MQKRQKLTTEDIKQNTKMYDQYHKEFKMDDGWLPGNKENNFEYMHRLMEFTGVPLSGTSCLDVGCGSGDLSRFLRQRGVKKYVGYDIYEPSLKRARKKYPDETFVLQDFLAAPIRKKFHYVFCSGAMTVKQRSTNNYDFAEAMIRKMWKLTKIGLVFNLLTNEDIYVDPNLFFYSREKIEKICKEIAPDAHIVSEKTIGVYQIHVYMWRNTTEQLK